MRLAVDFQGKASRNIKRRAVEIRKAIIWQRMSTSPWPPFPSGRQIVSGLSQCLPSQKKSSKHFWINDTNGTGGCRTIILCHSRGATRLLMTKARPLKDKVDKIPLHLFSLLLILWSKPSQFLLTKPARGTEINTKVLYTFFCPCQIHRESWKARRWCITNPNCFTFRPIDLCCTCLRVDMKTLKQHSNIIVVVNSNTYIISISWTQ